MFVFTFKQNVFLVPPSLFFHFFLLFHFFSHSLSHSSFTFAFTPTFTHLVLLYYISTMTQTPNDIDIIAPHSDSLCRQFNQDHPTTVLNIARFFIGSKDQSKQITSVRVVQVCQDGLWIEGETLKSERFKLSVSFSGGSVQSLAMAREAFLELGRKADRGLLHQATLRPVSQSTHTHTAGMKNKTIGRRWTRMGGWFDGKRRQVQTPLLFS